jgi:hypothetical protein
MNGFPISRGWLKMEVGMNPPLQSFVSVALPIIVTLVLGIWTNNSRLADLRSDNESSF